MTATPEQDLQHNVDLQFLRPYLDSVEEDKNIYRYRIPEGVAFEFDMVAMKMYFGPDTSMKWQRNSPGGRHTCYLDLQLMKGINYSI